MHRNKRGGKNFVKRGNLPKIHLEKAGTVHAEHLQEIHVGISEYINEGEGFSAILKARYSDFQVNEINLAGEVAVLTNTRIPPEFINAKNAKESVELTETTPLEIIPQETWDQILEMLKSTENKIVEFEVTSLSKEQRGEIHNIVKKVFTQKIVASTISKEDKKYLEFKKYNKGDKLERSRNQWPKDLGQYVHFLVYKENIDTLEATLRLSDHLKVKPSAFTYAGVKDRRAKTTQWFCVRRVDPWKLLNKSRPLRMLRLGNMIFKNEPLKLGQLKGNKFRVALRNVIADDALINSAMECLREKGFINYYGLQRFGNDKEVPTYEIGLQLLLGNFKKACDLILKCKTSDDPNSDITSAKQIYNNTGNAKAASECFKENTNKCVESKLIHGLAKTNKNEYVNALENIPRNMRLMYIHAFQALIWNRMVSRRIKEFGLKPIVGDMVNLVQSEGEETEAENDVDQEEPGSDDELEKDSTPKTVKRKEQIKHLTLEDLENYTIYDVVLPLPGYDIKYPDNTVKDWYKEILEERGLSLEMPRQRVKTYTLSGTYRNVVQKPTDCSWKIMRYKDPNDNLIHSDFDQILGREEPQDCPNGKYKALVMEFCLRPSSYATMAVREILKTDTSKSTQEKLNSYHDVVTSAKKEAPPNCAQPRSLLADPEKFAEFKRSIFGNANEENTPKRKCDEEIDENSVAKKTKIDKADVDDNEAKDVNMKLEPSLV